MFTLLWDWFPDVVCGLPKSLLKEASYNKKPNYFLEVHVKNFTFSFPDRYKAVMKPLGTQTSKTMAKLIICLIWVLSLPLASPLGFFYDLKYMQDEATGKAKSSRFRACQNHLIHLVVQ